MITVHKIDKKNVLEEMLDSSIFDNEVTACKENIETTVNEIKNEISSNNVSAPLEKLNIMESYLKSQFTPELPSFEITQVIKERGGNCMGLSTLYKIVGDRLGLPLYLIIMKKVGDEHGAHAYLLFDDKKTRVPIDTQGATDRERLSDKEIKSVVSVLSKPESHGFEIIDSETGILKEYLRNAAFCYYHSEKDFKKSVHYFEQLKQKFPDVELGNTYWAAKMKSKGVQLTGF